MKHSRYRGRSISPSRSAAGMFPYARETDARAPDRLWSRRVVRTPREILADGATPVAGGPAPIARAPVRESFLSLAKRRELASCHRSRASQNVSDRLLTTREVAAMLRVSPETVLRWYRGGKLPGGRRLGSNVLRFDADELAAWLEGTRPDRPLVAVRRSE